MSKTKVGTLLVAVSIYVMVLVPILMDPDPIRAAALWTFMYLMGCVVIFGMFMIMSD